jgi:hypothetical protein
MRDIELEDDGAGSPLKNHKFELEKEAFNAIQKWLIQTRTSPT